MFPESLALGFFCGLFSESIFLQFRLFQSVIPSFC